MEISEINNKVLQNCLRALLPGNREIETKLDGLSLIMINLEFGLQSKIETLVRINLEHPPIHCSIEKAKIFCITILNSEQKLKFYN